MKNEIHECDHCHKKADNPETRKELGLIRITVGTDITYSSYSGNTVHPKLREWQAEWCRECQKKFGVTLQWDPEKRPPEAKAPTLEEVVREICREEIQNETGAC